MNRSLSRFCMKRPGFTLIELLVVVGIIGLLATLAVVQLGRSRDRAKAAQVLANFKAIESSLLQYREDQMITEWWTEGVIASGHHDFSYIVANTGMRNYLPTAPLYDGSVDYHYDNDGDNFDPDRDGCGNFSNGVNLSVQTYDDSMANELDRLFDNADGLNCGRIHYYAPLGVLVYKLSHNSMEYYY